jgi:hypothetical protein
MKRISLVGLLMLGLTIPGVASAATPAPAWQLSITPYPTIFPLLSAGEAESGPGYLVSASNVGGEETHGQVVIEDTLPPGLSFSVGQPPTAHSGFETTSVALSCETVVQTAICRNSGPILPGQIVTFYVPVSTGPVPSASLTDTATISGGGAQPLSRSVNSAVSSDATPFSFLEGSTGASGALLESDGSPATQAGSHPYSISLALNVSSQGPKESGDTLRVPGGGLRRITGELPQGMIINPQAAVQCTEKQLTTASCPPASQVGSLLTSLDLAARAANSFLPLYNMVPSTGTPAVLGTEVLEGVYIHLVGGVHSSGNYQLEATVSEIPAKVGIASAEVTLWGDPTSADHNAVRGFCPSLGGSCPSESLNTPFLSLPSSCSASPPISVFRIANWIGESLTGGFVNASLAGEPEAIDGCNQLEFNPTISSQPTTNAADSPAGLRFDLHQPQDESLDGLAVANLKDATVALAGGLALNPSAANGLGSCDESQIGYQPTGGAVHFSETPQTCPASAKIGAVQVSTPLLDHKLPGSIYVARPFENPFGSLLAIYLAVEDEATGIVAKLAGKVSANSSTGQLTASFEENPELPLEDIELNLFDGPRAALTSPLTCGTHTTTSTLTPWSTPEGADASPTSSFQTTVGCSGSEGQAPKSVSFTAGTQSLLSGSYSPFVLRISRPDGSQHIAGLEATLPGGLLGKLAGVAYCPEQGIAQAISREHPEQGKTEQQNPSCPSSSEVGTVEVTAGAGISPIPVSGHAYLAGPYKGAPLSLVVIVPAVAGPFDLGTVVDRVALNVGEYDARIHAVADPLPTIREGIPLDVRSIELKLDRPDFTLNPTSCEAKAIEGSASTQAGQSASLNNHFQVGECARLAFKPKVAVSLKGATKKNGLPALKATVSYPQGGAYANIARAQVSLPHSEFLEQGNIGQACTKVILAARACPAKSIYGKAKAWTPLLDKPLEGPVYLVGGYGYKLPAMVAELDGQIRVLLVGKIDTGSTNGIRNTFEAVPDAPVEKFTLELKGGKKYGLLINSENICKTKQVGQAFFKAQNGKTLTLKPVIANSCKGGSRKRKGDGRKNPKHHGKKKNAKAKNPRKY